jgi:hypothetical protein
MRLHGFHYTALACLALTCAVRAADWEEPKNGLFTEKQLVSSVAATKEMMQYLKAAGKAIEGSKGGIGAMSVIGGVDKKVNDILARNGLEKAEHDWLSGKVFECLGAIMTQDMLNKGAVDLAEQKKKNAADRQAASEKIKVYEAALKAGTHVLTAEAREEIVRGAKEQQMAAEAEAQTHVDEAKAAAEEVSKANTSAAEAAALAKKPPADVEADAKADYSKGKTDEAAASRATAKEAGDREKEARKLEVECRAKAAGFAKQAAHPEIPVTPDDIAETKKNNEQGLTDTKAEAETLEQATGILKEAEVNLAAQRVELLKNVKPENLALAKKHEANIRAAWGMPRE